MYNDGNQILAIVIKIDSHKNSSIFSVALYMIYMFLQILHNALKFSLMGKRLTQFKINLQQFPPIKGHVLELLCIALCIVYRFLYSPYNKV